MFKEINSLSSEVRDFQVSLAGFKDSNAIIKIGPRFRRQFVRGFNTSPFDSVLNYFYSPEDAFSGFGTFLFNILKNSGREKEISKYFCVTPLADGSYPPVVSGGEFEIPMDVEIFFWMKVCNADYRSRLTEKTFSRDLEDKWSRVEFGTSVPVNQAPKRDVNLNLTYFNNVPFLKVVAKKTGLSVVYYDVGDLKYSSEIYVREFEGVNIEFPFDYRKISSFYD